MRGDTETIAFASAMTRELSRNAHKGHWSEMSDHEAVRQLFYHALKGSLAFLGLWQLEDGGKLELLADVGNHAMFMADNRGVLTAEALKDPTIAYSGDVDTFEMFKELSDWMDKHLLKETD